MIYFASKVKHAARWRKLRDVGVPVISTWIDEPDPPPDMRDLWERCIREASQARVLIAYLEPDETLKGGLCEVGATLAGGGFVYWVGPVGRNSITKHWRVRVYNAVDPRNSASLETSIIDAFELIRGEHLSSDRVSAIINAT